MNNKDTIKLLEKAKSLFEETKKDLKDLGLMFKGE